MVDRRGAERRLLYFRVNRRGVRFANRKGAHGHCVCHGCLNPKGPDGINHRTRTGAQRSEPQRPKGPKGIKGIKTVHTLEVQNSIAPIQIQNSTAPIPRRSRRQWSEHESTVPPNLTLWAFGVQTSGAHAVTERNARAPSSAAKGLVVRPLWFSTDCSNPSRSARLHAAGYTSTPFDHPARTSRRSARRGPRRPVASARRSHRALRSR